MKKLLFILIILGLFSCQKEMQELEPIEVITDYTLKEVTQKHKFELFVTGKADSVEVFVNGNHIIDKMPFYYTDIKKNYDATVYPILSQGTVRVEMWIDGKCVEKYDLNIKG